MAREWSSPGNPWQLTLDHSDTVGSLEKEATIKRGMDDPG